MRALPPLRRRRRRGPIAAGIGAIAAAAVGTLVVVSDDPVATSAAPNVEVSDVVVTQAPPGGVSVLSFTVRNRSNQDDALVAVTTPVAANASLHATRDVEGRAEMQPVAQIAVAPGQTRELGDATSHIMLLDLHEALEPGLTVQVELRFARAEPMDVDATVTA
jgi:copper(I)-binding protein